MELLQQLTAAAGVLALLAATIWMLKKNRLVIRHPKKFKQMELLERVPLSPQHTLALVRVKGGLVLVGTGPGVCEIRNVEVTS